MFRPMDCVFARISVNDDDLEKDPRLIIILYPQIQDYFVAVALVY